MTRRSTICPPWPSIWTRPCAWRWSRSPRRSPRPRPTSARNPGAERAQVPAPSRPRRHSASSERGTPSACIARRAAILAGHGSAVRVPPLWATTTAEPTEWQGAAPPELTATRKMQGPAARITPPPGLPALRATPHTPPHPRHRAQATAPPDRASGVCPISRRPDGPATLTPSNQRASAPPSPARLAKGHARARLTLHSARPDMRDCPVRDTAPPAWTPGRAVRPRTRPAAPCDLAGRADPRAGPHAPSRDPAGSRDRSSPARFALPLCRPMG